VGKCRLAGKVQEKREVIATRVRESGGGGICGDGKLNRGSPAMRTATLRATVLSRRWNGGFWGFPQGETKEEEVPLPIYSFEDKITAS